MMKQHCAFCTCNLTITNTRKARTALIPNIHVPSEADFFPPHIQAMMVRYYLLCLYISITDIVQDQQRIQSKTPCHTTGHTESQAEARVYFPLTIIQKNQVHPFGVMWITRQAIQTPVAKQGVSNKGTTGILRR